MHAVDGIADCGPIGHPRGTDEADAAGAAGQPGALDQPAVAQPRSAPWDDAESHTKQDGPPEDNRLTGHNRVCHRWMDIALERTGKPDNARRAAPFGGHHRRHGASRAAWWVGGGIELHRGTDVLEGRRRNGDEAAGGPVEVEGDEQHEADEHGGQHARQSSTAEDGEVHAEQGKRQGSAGDLDDEDGRGHSVGETGDSGDAGVEGLVERFDVQPWGAGLGRALQSLSSEVPELPLDLIAVRDRLAAGVVPGTVSEMRMPRSV